MDESILVQQEKFGHYEMIFSKIVVILFFILFAIKPIDLASSHIPKTGLLNQFICRAEKLIPISKRRKTTHAIRVTNNQIRDVQPIHVVNEQFKILMDQERYVEINKLGERIGPEEFSKQICLVVKTFKQYKGIIHYLRHHKIVANFYMHGSMNVVREAILAESKIYDRGEYFSAEDLETVLRLALNEDHHDRFIELLKVRMEITMKKDKQLELEGKRTSFEWFVYWFLHDLIPRKMNIKALKRFLTLYADELNSKHPAIINAFHQGLVDKLSSRLYSSNSRTLLSEFIGQPTSLTSVQFAKGFLRMASDETRSNFIKYGWGEAIQEGLGRDYEDGGERLWHVIKWKYPNQFYGEYPPPQEMLAIVLKHFPTKRQLEEEWANRNVVIFFNKIKGLGCISDLFPRVLWLIISNYAISWTDTDDSTISEK